LKIVKHDQFTDDFIDWTAAFYDEKMYLRFFSEPRAPSWKIRQHAALQNRQYVFSKTIISISLLKTGNRSLLTQ
jgi:hypothetical protein